MFSLRSLASKLKNHKARKKEKKEKARKSVCLFPREAVGASEQMVSGRLVSSLRLHFPISEEGTHFVSFMKLNQVVPSEAISIASGAS